MLDCKKKKKPTPKKKPMFSLNITLEKIAESLTLEEAIKVIQIVHERNEYEKYEHATESSNESSPCDYSSQRLLPVNKYFKTNNTIDHDYFFKKCNDLVFNKGFTTFTWYNGRCPLCQRNYSHECCASCKQEKKNCHCKYCCALVYPSTYAPDGTVATWAKCPYYTDDINLQNDHMKSCKGTITEDLVITFLKVEKHPYKENAIITTPMFIDLNKHQCKTCNRIHSPKNECY